MSIRLPLALLPALRALGVAALATAAALPARIQGHAARFER